MLITKRSTPWVRKIILAVIICTMCRTHYNSIHDCHFYKFFIYVHHITVSAISIWNSGYIFRCCSDWSINLSTFFTRVFISCLYVVFAGPVHWTKKMTETELNPTTKDQTTGCSCPNFEIFWLPVAMFVEKSKDQKKPVFHPVTCCTLLTHIFT